MASWDYDTGRSSSWGTAYGLLALLIIVACIVVVGVVEGSSLNPDTDCAWNQVRTSAGECR